MLGQMRLLLSSWFNERIDFASIFFCRCILALLKMPLICVNVPNYLNVKKFKIEHLSMNDLDVCMSKGLTIEML